jgi:UDP-2,3-diacylglucosamine hydrolase
MSSAAARPYSFFPAFCTLVSGMTTYFISDIHLGLADRTTERDKETTLLRFLDQALANAEALCIVGDLFDFWFEYRTVIPKGFHRTLAALQRFTDAGIPVHYLTGNHDFWMGEFFPEEIGIRIYREPVELPLGGKRVYLHHGDGLAPNDTGYRLIKPILRNRWSIRLYRWLHPDLGVPLARGSSRSSREYTSGREYGEGEGMAAFAAERIREGIDIVVMGHRHVPEIVPMDGGTYVNLGDWITHRTYGTLVNGVMTLQRWSGEQHG